jgi:hypothetical protein
MENLFENWGEVKGALLEGLTPSKQQIVATLLENQKDHILKETAAAGAVQAHDIAGFRKIMIPMIRRIIPGTIGTELVGVQPMTGPVGLVYSLRYRYAEAVNGPAGQWGGDINIAAGDEAFGNAKPIRGFYSGSTGSAQPAGAGGIGDAGTDGTSEPIAISGAGTGLAWPSSLNSGATPGWPHANTPAITPPFGGSLHGGSGSFIEGSGGRKMTLDIVSQAVEAGSRKLQAGWTIEAMQDLQSQHGMDLEAEMTKALSTEIIQEIDYEIISDLRALAGTIDTFDAAGAGAYGTGGNYTPTFIGDRLANLGIIINRVANEIGRKTRKGAANWLVCSPMMVTVLQAAAKSVWAPAVEGSFKSPTNTFLAGTLNGTIKVYSYLWNQAGAGVDLSVPGVRADDLILGYKGGSSETDAGYFYCPYIPLMSSGVIVNPVTFQPVVSLMTRYGKAVFTNTATSLGNSADYYGKITVNNLDLA